MCCVDVKREGQLFDLFFLFSSSILQFQHVNMSNTKDKRLLCFSQCGLNPPISIPHRMGMPSTSRTPTLPSSDSSNGLTWTGLTKLPLCAFAPLGPRSRTHKSGNSMEFCLSPLPIMGCHVVPRSGHFPDAFDHVGHCLPSWPAP